MQFFTAVAGLLAVACLLVSPTSGNAVALRNVEEDVAIPFGEFKRDTPPRDTVTTTVTVYQCSNTVTSSFASAPPSTGAPPVSTSVPASAPSTSGVQSTVPVVPPPASTESSAPPAIGSNTSAPPAPPTSGSSATPPLGSSAPPSETSSPGAPPATESNTSAIPPPTESSAPGTQPVTIASSTTITSLESSLAQSTTFPPPTGSHNSSGSHTGTSTPSSTLPPGTGSGNHVSHNMVAVIAGMGFAALAAV